MATIENLAAEYGMTAYGLRAFADDLLDDVVDDFTTIPSEVEDILREALTTAR